MPMTPEKRRRAGRIGGLTTYARHGNANARRGSAAFLDRFRRQVDPDGTLDPTEREKRTRAALRVHMARIAARPRNRTLKSRDEFDEHRRKNPAEPLDA